MTPDSLSCEGKRRRLARTLANSSVMPKGWLHSLSAPASSACTLIFPHLHRQNDDRDLRLGAQLTHNSKPSISGMDKSCDDKIRRQSLMMSSALSPSLRHECHRPCETREVRSTPGKSGVRHPQRGCGAPSVRLLGSRCEHLRPGRRAGISDDRKGRVFAPASAARASQNHLSNVLLPHQLGDSFGNAGVPDGQR